MKSLFNLSQYLKGCGWLAGFVVVIQLISNLATITIPLVLGKYYQIVFDLASYRANLLAFLPETWFAESWMIFVLFAALFLTKLSAFFLAKFSAGVLGENLTYELRNALFKAQLNIPYDHYRTKGMGRYLLRYSGDLQSVKNFAIKGFLLFIADVILLIFLFVVLWGLNRPLTLIFFTTGFIFTIIFRFLNNKLGKSVENYRNRKSNLLSYVSRTLQSIISVNVFNRFSVEERNYNRYSLNLKKAALDYQVALSVFQSVIQAVSLVLLFLALLSSYYLKNFKVDGVTLLITIMLVVSLLPLVRRLLRIRLIWEKGKLSLMKIQKVFLLSERSDKSWEGLTNLTIQRKNGERVAIQFPGFHVLSEPNDLKLIYGKLLDLNLEDLGDIDHGGKSSVSRFCWSKNIATVEREHPLMGRTVVESISYRVRASTRGRAVKILEGILLDLPQKLRLSLDQKIGDKGCLLEGWQVTLLLYCRALMTRKRILVINESISGLPEIVRERIKNILCQYARKKTILLSAAVASDFHEIIHADRQQENAVLNV